MSIDLPKIPQHVEGGVVLNTRLSSRAMSLKMM